MPQPSRNGAPPPALTGHALRNAHLCDRALVRARTAPPLARAAVTVRAGLLRLTRLEFARRSGISRGALRDLELGIHTPTRQTLQQFVAFCQRQGVAAEPLEELRRLYAGPGDTLEQFVARLELRAGSPRELARRVGISTSTLWEYRRGNFPLPLALLKRLCEAVGEDPAPAESLWHAAQRRRFLDKGYPEAWAELCVLCARAGRTDSYLLRLGVSTAAFRRLRYLELPPWPAVAAAARRLCRDDAEWESLKSLWQRGRQQQRDRLPDAFGMRLKELREQRGLTRRQIADLFGVGGKKPARIIKYIEEDGFFSMQAYPAGLAALLTADLKERDELLERWEERRRQFHCRRRPEMRADLRLARERYGFELKDAAALLGYTGPQYQRIERGVEPLLDTARSRIVHALEQAGRLRVEQLLQRWHHCVAEQDAWQAPASLPGMITLLARREGGLIPLARFLKEGDVRGFSPARLRALAQGRDVPAWFVVEQFGRACGVTDFTDVRRDWYDRYRARLQRQCGSPLGIELRLLIAEAAPSLRAFSPRLGFNYSVLVREFQRLDRDEPIGWPHVERILRALRLPVDGPEWRMIRSLWSTADARNKRPAAK
jgi:transcriptional regulator with XRE-family HTH domain